MPSRWSRPGSYSKGPRLCPIRWRLPEPRGAPYGEEQSSQRAGTEPPPTLLKRVEIAAFAPQPPNLSSTRKTA